LEAITPKKAKLDMMLTALKNEPIEKMLPKDPIDPTEKADPLDPIERIEFSDHRLNTEFFDPTLRIEFVFDDEVFILVSVMCSPSQGAPLFSSPQKLY
jgi:hypothetical protein